MKNSKIFGIGLSRTGTSSLTHALRILGYSACHFPKNLKNALENYEALTDTPIAKNFKELDKLYPNSKFILTIRDMNNWLKSMKTHFDLYPSLTRETWILQLRKDLYQTKDFNKNLLEKSYYRHIENVKKYFKNRESDLLIMDITRGDGWDILCKFLTKKIPETNFPKVNTSSQKTTNKKV